MHHFLTNFAGDIMDGDEFRYSKHKENEHQLEFVETSCLDSLL